MSWILIKNIHIRLNLNRALVIEAAALIFGKMANQSKCSNANPGSTYACYTKLIKHRNVLSRHKPRAYHYFLQLIDICRLSWVYWILTFAQMSKDWMVGVFGSAHHFTSVLRSETTLNKILPVPKGVQL